MGKEYGYVGWGWLELMDRIFPIDIYRGGGRQELVKRGFMREKDAHVFYSQNRNQGFYRACRTQQVPESTFRAAHVDLGSMPLAFTGPILLEHEPFYGAHLGRVT